MLSSILNVNGHKASLMLLSILDDSNTTSVPSSSHHNNVAHIKLDEVDNFVRLQVKLDCVVSLDEWVRVANGASIIGVQIGNALLVELNIPDLAELVL